MQTNTHTSPLRRKARTDEPPRVDKTRTYAARVEAIARRSTRNAKKTGMF